MSDALIYGLAHGLAVLAFALVWGCTISSVRKVNWKMIVKYIKEIEQDYQTKYEITKDNHMAELWRIREESKKKNRPLVWLRAEELRGKLMAYYIDKKQNLNVNKTFRMFNDDVQRMLSDKILETPVNQRQPLKNLITSLSADEKNLTAIGQKFSASKTQLDQVVNTKQRLIDLLPTLKDNEKLIVRNLISDYNKY